MRQLKHLPNLNSKRGAEKMDRGKSKMYACIVFFEDGLPKRWKYVRDLKSFSVFLNKSHSSWKYFNVYEKSTGGYLKRYYPGNLVPKVLGVLLICVALIQPIKSNITFNTSFNAILKSSYPQPNTFNNGLNNTATIQTPLIQKGESL